jgi:hypothetical protein
MMSLGLIYVDFQRLESVDVAVFLHMCLERALAESRQIELDKREEKLERSRRPDRRKVEA